MVCVHKYIKLHMPIKIYYIQLEIQITTKALQITFKNQKLCNTTDFLTVLELKINKLKNQLNLVLDDSLLFYIHRSLKCF